MELKILAVKSLLFICLAIFCYELKSQNIIKKTFNNLLNISEKKFNRRIEENQKIRLEEGNVENKTFINRMDLLIERSQIKKHITFNTDIYITLIILFIFGGIAVGSFFSKWLIGLIVGIVLSLSMYALLHLLSNINYEKIDKDILTFTNIMENLSGTNDDIVNIMGKTYPYLNKPLCYHIEDFYNKSVSTGDISKAFKELEMKIENERVRDIIRNIEICSRHEANYKEIIKDSRETLKDYLKAKQQRKAIISNGRKDILMCLTLSSIMLYIFNSFVTNLFDKLINSTVGIGIILYCIIVGILIILNLISFDKGGK